jgi:hypothetical protein
MVWISSGWTLGSLDSLIRLAAKFSGCVGCLVAKMIVFSEPGMSTV